MILHYVNGDSLQTRLRSPALYDTRAYMLYLRGFRTRNKNIVIPGANIIIT